MDARTPVPKDEIIKVEQYPNKKCAMSIFFYDLKFLKYLLM